MSESPPSKSHAAIGSLIAVAALLCYFLSVPWLPIPTESRSTLTRMSAVYCIPWGWAFHTPLGPVLNKYRRWVFAKRGFDVEF